ncbi:MAG TPA: right-handed parallel beta-helix repeat-containing protein, partial [Planctomycetota bacterium]|nr:right-handed parallel beta-helix repeat-containing protein [Planctomycetota bacterium]
SLIPELVRFEADSVPGGGRGREIFAGGASADLEGIANPAITRSVKVGGVLATITGRPPGSGPPYALLWQASVPLASSVNRVKIEGFSGPNGTGVVVETADVVIHRLEKGLTDAVGSIAGAVTWKRDDGPYVVSSRLRVNAGASLRIEPGTRVLFARGASITVDGVLDASGTAGDPIYLGSLALAPWGGIHLASTGTEDADPVHVLRHVRVEHGSAASGQSGCLSILGAKARVEGCRFTSLTRSAIDARNSRLEVTDSVFEDVQGGVVGAGSTVIVSGSTFLNVQGGNDAIRLRGNGAGRSRIEGSLVEGSEDDGLELLDASVDVVRNTVRSIADRACLLDGEGLLGASIVDGNVFHDAEVGLELRNGSVVGGGSHDTIASCVTGLALSGDPQAEAPGLAAFHSMILWHNEVSVAVEGGSALELAWSDVDWEPAWPGVGNLRADPRFRDMFTGDFGLAPGSPCLRAGKDGSDMGATGEGPGGPAFLRGDATDDGVVNLTDAIIILEYLFSGLGALECEKSADTDDNGTVNLTDVIHLLDHLFRGGPAVAPPFPDTGPDPTEDALGCR